MSDVEDILAVGLFFGGLFLFLKSREQPPVVTGFPQPRRNGLPDQTLQDILDRLTRPPISCIVQPCPPTPVSPKPPVVPPPSTTILLPPVEPVTQTPIVTPAGLSCPELSGTTGSDILKETSRFEATILNAANRFGIDADLIRAIMWRESLAGRLSPNLTQITDIFIRQFGCSASAKLNFVENILCAARGLSSFLEEFGLPRALSAYRRGPTAVRGGVRDPNYENCVLLTLNEIKKAKSMLALT